MILDYPPRKVRVIAGEDDRETITIMLLRATVSNGRFEKFSGGSLEGIQVWLQLETH